MAPPRSSLHGGLKKKTRWTSAMTRSPTACMPELHGWHWMLGWPTRLLDSLPEGQFLLKLKFLREKAEDDWVVEDKFDPVRAGRKKGQGVIEVSQDTKPGVLTGIDSVFYQNAYPVTALVYGLYPIRDPDPANLAPLRHGDLNCVAQRVMEHFERPWTHIHAVMEATGLGEGGGGGP